MARAYERVIYMLSENIYYQALASGTSANNAKKHRNYSED